MILALKTELLAATLAIGRTTGMMLEQRNGS
jgi:hypothetical protein